MDPREKRLARNEVVFRDVNEAIDKLAAPQGSASERFEFLCECSNLDCTLRLRITLGAYEEIRSDPTLFLVAPGHELPEIERVLRRHEDYQVVKKVGEAADLVAARDPRT